MSATQQASGEQTLAEKLAPLAAIARSDLVVSRNVFGRDPYYVVRDPMTGRTHQMPPDEYEVFCRISAGRTLESTFEELERDDLVAKGDAEEFYRFAASLHTLGLVQLPITDSAALYGRIRQRRQMMRRRKLLNIFMMQVPLFSPDSLLNRTAVIGKVLFSKPAFVAWCVLMAFSVYVMCHRFEDILSPFLSLVQLHNLPWLALVLISLKTIHEFGHAYACKVYGGQVPEMGLMFIVVTPLAYVDATSSWNFPQKKDRIIVCLAGMYVESILAAAALFVWAFTDPSLLNTIAYQTFVMASLVTLLFNINPLMKFDGYYALSDILGVPNLRARSSAAARRVFDRLVLGIRAETKSPHSRRMTAFLILLGIASTIYKFFLVLSICSMIATAFYFVGLAFAAFYVVQSLGALLWGWVHHLCLEKSTAPARGRAIAVCAVLFVGLPLTALWLPVSMQVVANGTVHAQDERVIRAPNAGFVRAIDVDVGQMIADDTPLVTLANTDVDHAAVEAESRRRSAEAEAASLSFEDPEAAAHAALRAKLRADMAAQAAQERAGLRVTSGTASGMLIRSLRPDDQGRWLAVGDEIAAIGEGQFVGKVLLDERSFARCNLALGASVECRVVGDPTRTYTAVVRGIGPRGSREIEDAALTSVVGGDIVVDESTGEAQLAHVEITLAFADAIDARFGMGVVGVFYDAPEPIANRVYRNVVRFANSLKRL